MDAVKWAEIGAFVLDALAVLLAPTAALVGALGGAVVANRRSAQREREQRAEALRDASRGLMVELLHSGSAWAVKLQHSQLSAIIDSMTLQTERRRDAAAEERAADLRALRSRLEMAFTDILLRVEEPGLRAVIEHCRAEMDRSVAITSVIEKKIRDNDSNITPEMETMFLYTKGFQSELRAMEQAAVPYFAAPIQ